MLEIIVKDINKDINKKNIILNDINKKEIILKDIIS